MNNEFESNEFENKESENKPLKPLNNELEPLRVAHKDCFSKLRLRSSLWTCLEESLTDSLSGILWLEMWSTLRLTLNNEVWFLLIQSIKNSQLDESITKYEKGEKDGK